MSDVIDRKTPRSAPVTASAQPSAVTVDVRELTVRIPTGHGTVVPADDVSLTVRQGEALGIVGETGSGKTVTCRAMLGLLPTKRSTHDGAVSFPAAGVDDVLVGRSRELRSLWGEYVSMIPQNPMTSLDPVRRIGAQISEAVAAHSPMSRAQRRTRVIELMRQVGIPAPEKRLRDYPHQFSGGMLQRTLIAIALAGHPKVLIADEPTTALDVIIQDQILGLLARLRREAALSLVLVSHDLSVVAQVCDRVAVMYAGQVVEVASVDEVLRAPKHPYTAALLRSLPGAVPRDEPLATIPGSPPQLIDLGTGCRFSDRCAHARPECRTWTNTLLPVAGTAREVRCVRHDELTLGIGEAPADVTAAPSAAEQENS